MSSPAADVDFEVAIIGAGDVGAAIARELCRFRLRVALLDSGDVGAGTSKANTALLHTGFDSKPGTLEARLFARGYELLLRYAGEVGIAVERTGALLVAWNERELARLPDIAANAVQCRHTRPPALTPEELYHREPHLGPGALGGLAVPDELIVCPWTPPLAYATQAVLAGAALRRGERLIGLMRLDGAWRLSTSRGVFTARWVINAPGCTPTKFTGWLAWRPSPSYRVGAS